MTLAALGLLLAAILLEVLGQGGACAKQEHLHRRLRKPQPRADLPVGQALPLPQEDDRAIALRHPLERLGNRPGLAGRGLRCCDDVLESIQVANSLDAAAPPGRFPTRPADVLRDLEQPGRLELRSHSPLKPAVSVEKGRLHRVLRLLAVPQEPQAIPEDSARVPGVQVRCGLRFGLPAELGLGDGRESAHIRLRPLTVGQVSPFGKGGGRSCQLSARLGGEG